MIISSYPGTAGIFTAKEEWKDRRVAVEFEGAMIVAEIFLNGEKLFEHKGGYTPFTVELTDKLLWGKKTNVLAVRLDSCCHPDVPPRVRSLIICCLAEFTEM